VQRLLLLVVLTLAACGAPARTSPGKRTGMAEPVSVQRGMATFYGREQHGGPTASGERFDMRKMTAAHRTLPFGTRVRVTNTRNGRSVEVRINDRGPYVEERVIDLSYAAALELQFIDQGTTRVRLEVLNSRDRRRGQ